MEWQPFDTAPKDGTHFLVFWRWPDGSVSGVAEIWRYDPFDDGDFAEWHGNLSDGYEASTECLGELTHWMPLPAPPAHIE